MTRSAVLSALLCSLLACAGSPAPAPLPSPAPYDDPVLNAAAAVMHGARYSVLITVGEDGHPQARIVDPFAPEEDLVVWIATRPTTRKVGQIRNDPRVTLHYFDPVALGYVTLLGTAQLVDDPREKALRWKEEWADFYSDRNRGDDYLLIRVVPTRLEMVSPAHGVGNDPDTWLPTIREFAPPPPIRIGATMSETGALATQGIPARNGYRLCEAHVNEQGGLLGRPVEFVIYDDRSDPQEAVALYERLIVEDRVDAVMGPYGSTHTEAVAPVTERHRFVHISPLAATSSIWEQGRRYIFMVLPPAELFLAGLIDMAAANGLETVAILQEDALFPKAAGAGAVELARRRGLRVVLHETYARGTTDFSALLERVRGADVLGMAASSLDDFVVVVRQLRERGIDVKMFGTSGAVAEFQQALGEAAEYAYGLSAWEPSLPNPGIDEFVAAYRRAFDAAPSFHAAGAYGSCQIFMEAARRAGSLDADALRDVLLELEMQTVFSDFSVDERGYQTANRGLFVQWQDGEKVVVWPEEFATGAARFPTPPWSER